MLRDTQSAHFRIHVFHPTKGLNILSSFRCIRANSFNSSVGLSCIHPLCIGTHNVHTFVYTYNTHVLKHSTPPKDYTFCQLLNIETKEGTTYFNMYVFHTQKVARNKDIHCKNNKKTPKMRPKNKHTRTTK